MRLVCCGTSAFFPFARAGPFFVIEAAVFPALWLFSGMALGGAGG